MPITFKRYRKGRGPWKSLDEVVDLYGVGPATLAQPLLDEMNSLPIDEQMKGAAEFVRQRLLNPNDEWWN